MDTLVLAREDVKSFLPSNAVNAITLSHHPSTLPSPQATKVTGHKSLQTWELGGFWIEAGKGYGWEGG